MWRRRQCESRALCERGSISAFGMNSTGCGLDKSGSGLSMLLRSCEHGDELGVSIKDEKCLERVSGNQLLKADSHITCRAHAVPLPCRAAKGLECVFPI